MVGVGQGGIGDFSGPVPDRLEAIDIEWLTRQLRASGESATVIGFRADPIGNGMMAATYRLHLDYSGSEDLGPASLAIKLTAPGERSRRTARNGFGMPGRAGLYEREVTFYSTFASEVLARVPRPYFAWVSEEGDRLALLLEDVTPARMGNDITGCTLADATEALRNLAGLHAPLWNSPQFDGPGFLHRPNESDAAAYVATIKACVRAYCATFASTHRAKHIPLIRTFAERAHDWYLADGHPLSLTHNDYRLDNLLFTDGPTQSVTLDWQTFMVAHPGRDLGLFLGASIPTDLRRNHTNTLLNAYHTELVAHGVDRYPFAQCLDDFRHGVFLGLQHALILSGSVDMTARGVEMFDGWLERACASISDLDAVDALPA